MALARGSFGGRELQLRRTIRGLKPCGCERLLAKTIAQLCSSAADEREDAKKNRRNQNPVFPLSSSLISSNFLFCWQDYVLTIPREEILQGWTG
jgi:hypothetical protein